MEVLFDIFIKIKLNKIKKIENLDFNIISDLLGEYKIFPKRKRDIFIDENDNIKSNNNIEKEIATFLHMIALMALNVAFF